MFYDNNRNSFFIFISTVPCLVNTPWKWMWQWKWNTIKVKIQQISWRKSPWYKLLGRFAVSELVWISQSRENTATVGNLTLLFQQAISYTIDWIISVHGVYADANFHFITLVRNSNFTTKIQIRLIKYEQILISCCKFSHSVVTRKRLHTEQVILIMI